MAKYFNNVKVNFENNEDISKENIIYKLTFPNGKVYIGQTSRNLNKRLSDHCNESFNIKKITKFNNLKANAIRKYMTFDVNILYQGEDLDNQEIKFIEEFKSTNKNFGYNLESGGNLNKYLSEETKRKISEANKGRILSEEAKQKIGKAHKNKIVSEETKRKIGESNKGKIVSEETKEKMRGINNPSARSIIVTEIKTGIETRFDYILEAAGYYEISDSAISKVLIGKYKTFSKKQYTAKYENK